MREGCGQTMAAENEESENLKVGCYQVPRHFEEFEELKKGAALAK